MEPVFWARGGKAINILKNQLRSELGDKYYGKK